MLNLDHADLVLLGDRVLRAPGQVMDLTCVARTSAGRRCKNFIEPGQTAYWAEAPTLVGLATVYDLSQADERTLARWQAQHCPTHDQPLVVDHQPPEWQDVS